MTLEGFETLTDEKELKGKGPAAGRSASKKEEAAVEAVLGKTGSVPKQAGKV